MELSDNELELIVAGKSRGGGSTGAPASADTPTVATAVSGGKKCGPSGCTV